jgi:hypothetical protein
MWSHVTTGKNRADLKSHTSRNYLIINKMKKIAITCLFIFSLVSISSAQDYRTGVGLRGGFESGLTIKHFVGEKSALEGIFSTRWRGFQMTGLYEIHNQAFNEERFKWFFGFGAHVGFWNGDYTYEYWGTQGTNYTVAGLDGILGLEYSFREVPINIGIDWKPTYNFGDYTGFWADGGALSIRYIF